MKNTIFILTTLALLLSACGGTPAAEAPPQLTGDDIQATAISIAWTMAAQTQTAMPTQTFTPLPPTATFTPAFTPTPIFTPTPLFTATPVPTATKAGGISICNWSGAATKLLFVNDTKATAGPISLYLTPGSNGIGYGDCFILVPGLEKNQSASVSAPQQGYYYVFAYMTSKDRKWSVEGGFGTNNPDKHEIHLTDSGIKVLNP